MIPEKHAKARRQVRPARPCPYVEPPEPLAKGKESVPTRGYGVACAAPSRHSARHRTGRMVARAKGPGRGDGVAKPGANAVPGLLPGAARAVRGRARGLPAGAAGDA